MPGAGTGAVQPIRATHDHPDREDGPRLLSAAGAGGTGWADAWDRGRAEVREPGWADARGVRVGVSV
ncbi:hypothetical protein GCM10010521_62800 [Streptomyces rameus]|uniref:Uncharacterized protein n=1 Tax=Streptomyces rameus TaxID=68261 RepID=A0ABN3V2C7_9ACTN